MTGHLIDGSSMDVTARRYGTVYSFSDLQIANFGPDDGRVYAGTQGQATVTVQVGGRSASSQIHVLTFSPTALSYLPIPGFANGIALGGDHAYIASGAAGLQVVDVSNPLLPRIVGSVSSPGNANDIRVVGDLAYVADGSAGLVIVDISRPDAPKIVGRSSTAGAATELVIRGNRAYVADEVGLTIVDVSNPAAPSVLGSVQTPGRARGVDVVEDLAVVAASESGIQIVDVSDPTHPVIVGATATRADGSSNAADVTVLERLAYVADGAEAQLGGLRVIDFRDPTNPVVVGSTSDQFALNSTALEHGLVLASDYYFVNGVPIFGESSDTPILRGVLDFSGSPSFRDDEGHGLAVRDGLVYLVGSKEISDNGATGNSALHIGRYASFAEADDAGLPPVVSVIKPDPGKLGRRAGFHHVARGSKGRRLC